LRNLPNRTGPRQEEISVNDRLVELYYREIKWLKADLDCLRNLPNRTGPSQEEISVNDRLVELYYREEIM
jgi:hypothetical protein